MSKWKNDDKYDDDDFESAGPCRSEQFRRPLRQGETVPPIPTMYEQVAMANAAPTRQVKSASR